MYNLLRLKKSLTFGLTVSGLAFAPNALAQDVPEARVIDELGVNLLTGRLEGSIPMVSIGSGEGALSETIAILGADGFQYGYVGKITKNSVLEDGTYSWNVILPGLMSVRFTTTTSTPTEGMIFEEFVKRGDALTFQNDEYTFVSNDGTIAKYSAGYRIQSVTKPNGATHTYDYIGQSMRSVRTNSGYQLKYQTTNGESRVYAINNAIEYCEPTATSCSVGSQWPYAVSDGDYTDAEGRIYVRERYNLPGATVLTIKKPGASSGQYFNAIYRDDSFSVISNGVGGEYTTTADDNSTPDDTEDDTKTVVSGTRTVVAKTKGSLVISDTSPLGTISYSYNSDNLVESVTYPHGDSVTYTYDERSNIIETRRASATGAEADLVTTASFPLSCTTSNRKYCNKPTYVIDTANNRTDFEYHPESGQISRITLPYSGQGPDQDIPETEITYEQIRAKVKNASGSLVDASPIWKPKTVTKLKGTRFESVTTYNYDVNKNLLPSSITTTVSGVSKTTNLIYDDFGNQIGVDGSLPGTQDYVTTRFDKLRRPTGSIGIDLDGSGNIKRRASVTTYDISGAIKKVESGTATTHGLSGFASFSLSQTTTNVLDEMGRTLSTNLRAGNAYQATVDYSYNTRGRVECAATRMNLGTMSGSHTDGCSATTPGIFGPDRISKVVYDDIGRVKESISALGTSAQSSTISDYYSHGPLKEISDGEGNKTYYTYDGFNRTSHVYYPKKAGSGHNSADYMRYDYDEYGRQHNTRQRDGQTVTKTFNAAGQITFINVPGNAEDTTLTYDIAGRPLSVGKASETLYYLYDDRGRLMSESTSLGVSVSYVYDDLDRRTRINYPGPNDFHVTYEYFGDGPLKAIEAEGATIASYTYDSQGRRKTVTRESANNVTTYNYDVLSRLQSLENDIPGAAMDQTLSYTYTPSGQIDSQINSNPAYNPTITEYTSDFVINGLNQIDEMNGALFTYDPAGNMETGGGNSYDYDYANRLTSVTGKGTLTYDPISRLRSITSGGTTKSFIYDGQDLIAEYYDGAFQTIYIHGPSTDEPLLEYHPKKGEVNWLIADARGSITGHVDFFTETTVATNKYDSYGQPQSDNAGRFQYTGQVWFEELGLYYYKARFYDPTIRRFLTTDPTGYGDGMNMYSYVSGDPINATDPSGLCSVTQSYSYQAYGGSTSVVGGTTFPQVGGTRLRVSGTNLNSDCWNGGTPGSDYNYSYPTGPYGYPQMPVNTGSPIPGGSNKSDNEDERDGCKTITQPDGSTFKIPNNYKLSAGGTGNAVNFMVIAPDGRFHISPAGQGFVQRAQADGNRAAFRTGVIGTTLAIGGSTLGNAPVASTGTVIDAIALAQMGPALATRVNEFSTPPELIRCSEYRSKRR